MQLSGQVHDLELLVGRIVAVEDHPGARAPSFLLTLDLGSQGRRDATFPASTYSSEELSGRQVVCALEGDGASLLTAHSRAKGLVLISPESEVEDGSMIA